MRRLIGQDSGDVYATVSLGYGYDPKLPEMSAIFFAAGPHVCEHHLDEVRNIDVAPTILGLLGVRPADTVEGRALRLCKDDDRDGRHGREDD